MQLPHLGSRGSGTAFAAVARFQGCSRIAIFDIDKYCVDFAVQQGFAEVGWPSMPITGADINEDLMNARTLADRVGAQTRPAGGNVGKLQPFECTGVPSCLQPKKFMQEVLQCISTDDS